MLGRYVSASLSLARVSIDILAYGFLVFCCSWPPFLSLYTTCRIGLASAVNAKVFASPDITQQVPSTHCADFTGMARVWEMKLG